MENSYSVLIPAYNAQDSIKVLLEQIRSRPLKPDKIIVVDDGSYDETSKISSDHNANVFTHKSNYGKGAALKKGFELFLNTTKSDFIVCLDSDLQHTPECIDDFIMFAKSNNSDVVIGKRDISIKTMPFLRYLSNKLSSKILTFTTGQEISDSQCGYRLIKRNILEKIKLHENGYQLETEFILECARQSINMEFIYIPTIYNGNNSYINHVKDTIIFFKLVIKSLFIR